MQKPLITHMLALVLLTGCSLFWNLAPAPSDFCFRTKVAEDPHWLGTPVAFREQLTWLRDGDRILIKNKAGSLFVVDVTENTEVSAQQMELSGNRFTYSPETGALALSDLDTSGPAKTRIYDFESGEFIKSTDDDFSAVAWSPDGTLLLGATSSGNEYWASVIELEDTNGEPQEVLNVSGNRKYLPVGWSTRKDRLAVEKETETGIKIFVVSLPDKEAVQLDEFVGCHESPDWSPTSAAIAFMGNPNGNWDILIEVPGTGNARNLTNSTEVDEYQPVWSPDGESIVYVGVEALEYAQSTIQEIYVVNVESGQIQQLTNTKDENEAFPIWSPDGKKIAYLSQIDDEIFLNTIDANGHNQTRIVSIPLDSPAETERVGRANRTP
jgi:Tol biopolymer transport system component